MIQIHSQYRPQHSEPSQVPIALPEHQNRFSLFLVSLVVLMIMVVVAVRSVELQRKIAGYDTQIASLSAQIDAETARAEEIEEYRKYTQTKAYVEEVAKDKLGLVYEGEILFKEDN